MIIRSPSSSPVKIEAIRLALDVLHLGQPFDVQGLPVELQDRSDLSIHAQPEGHDETIAYARERLRQMHALHGPTPGLDIGIESGAIDALDVACVVVHTRLGEAALALSEGVAFPAGSLEAARARGFKSTTAGDIIHEQHPNIPANNWQEYFPPYISRQQQIQGAIVTALRMLPGFAPPV